MVADREQRTNNRQRIENREKRKENREQITDNRQRIENSEKRTVKREQRTGKRILESTRRE